VGYGSLLVMLISAKKLRPAYTAWFICYFVICYGTTWLLSGPRYMAVFFPLAIAADELPLKKWMAPLGCGILGALYCVCFALRWGVW